MTDDTLPELPTEPVDRCNWVESSADVYALRNYFSNCNRTLKSSRAYVTHFKVCPYCSRAIELLLHNDHPQAQPERGTNG